MTRWPHLTPPRKMGISAVVCQPIMDWNRGGAMISRAVYNSRVSWSQPSLFKLLCGFFIRDDIPNVHEHGRTDSPTPV